VSRGCAWKSSKRLLFASPATRFKSLCRSFGGLREQPSVLVRSRRHFAASDAARPIAFQYPPAPDREHISLDGTDHEGDASLAVARRDVRRGCTVGRGVLA
jgi:hypothetical protein